MSVNFYQLRGHITEHDSLGNGRVPSLSVWRQTINRFADLPFNREPRFR